MSSEEISRSEWREFLDSFSRQHEGWLVTVEIQRDDEAAVEAREAPLAGVTADDSGLAIVTAHGARTHTTHNVTNPTRLMLERTERGADRGLTIEAADGTRTIVRFRAAARVEEVDGI